MVSLHVAGSPGPLGLDGVTPVSDGVQRLLGGALELGHRLCSRLNPASVLTHPAAAARPSPS